MIHAMTGGAAVAAAAAQQRRLREQAEEEEMVHYGAEDLANDWEFKIVRANTTAFRNPPALNQLLQQEALAGWTMVEKFDDSRVRFKRPRQARLRDSTLPPGLDPYRTHYGMSPVTFGLVTAMVSIGLAAGLIALILFLIR